MQKEKAVNFNSLLGIIAIGATGWVGSTTFDLSKKMSRVETLLEVRSEQAASMERRVLSIEAALGIKPKP